ncbi:MAG: hypothetical protein ABI120_13535 [Gemmatimonadaceae bacterium]
MMPHKTSFPKAATDNDARGLMALFTGVADRWQLSVEERCTLLGDVARSTHYEWTGKNPPKTLTTDQRTRIALLVAIDLQLHAFYGLHSANARTHVRRTGTAPSGHGTALAVMLAGPGYIGIEKVREHVEGLNGGSATITLSPEDWAQLAQ